MKKATIGALLALGLLLPMGAVASPLPQTAAFMACTMDCVVVDSKAISGSSAVLTRTATGMSVKVTSKGLAPGNIHTIWFIVFNAPHNCVSNRQGPVRCGAADVFEPLADASHIWGGSFTAAANGTVTSAAAGITKGDLTHDPFSWEHGLTNVYYSEVAVILRDHGAPNGAPDQSTTMNGGCVQAAPMVGTGSIGRNNCENKQGAAFPAAY